MNSESRVASTLPGKLNVRAGSRISSSAIVDAGARRRPRSSNSFSIAETIGSNCSKGNSPSCFPMTRPSGSMNISVGHARPPKRSHTLKSRSFPTGCSMR
jgi:hypothetical protein